MYTWGTPVVELISSRAADTISRAMSMYGIGLLRGYSLKYFAFFIIYYVKGCFFLGTALCGGFIILSTVFILTYLEEKFSGEYFLQVDF